MNAFMFEMLNCYSGLIVLFLFDVGLRSVNRRLSSVLDTLCGVPATPATPAGIRFSTPLAHLALLHANKRVASKLNLSTQNLHAVTHALLPAVFSAQHSPRQSPRGLGSPRFEVSASSGVVPAELCVRNQILRPLQRVLLTACVGFSSRCEFARICQLIIEICGVTVGMSDAASGAAARMWCGVPFPANVPDETVVVLRSGYESAVTHESKHDDDDVIAAADVIPVSNGIETTSTILGIIASAGCLDVLVTSALLTMSDTASALSSSVVIVAQLLTALIYCDNVQSHHMPYLMRALTHLATGLTHGIANIGGSRPVVQLSSNIALPNLCVWRPSLSTMTTTIMAGLLTSTSGGSLASRAHMISSIVCADTFTHHDNALPFDASGINQYTVQILLQQHKSYAAAYFTQPASIASETLVAGMHVWYDAVVSFHCVHVLCCLLLQINVQSPIRFNLVYPGITNHCCNRCRMTSWCFIGIPRISATCFHYAQHL